MMGEYLLWPLEMIPQFGLSARHTCIMTATNIFYRLEVVVDIRYIVK